MTGSIQSFEAMGKEEDAGSKMRNSMMVHFAIRYLPEVGLKSDTRYGGLSSAVSRGISLIREPQVQFEGKFVLIQIGNYPIFEIQTPPKASFGGVGVGFIFKEGRSLALLSHSRGLIFSPNGQKVIFG